MINVRCFTNLDVREQWPTKLPCRPIVGDIIRSERGLDLMVIRIVFDEFDKRRVDRGFEFGGTYLEKHESEILVELHLPPNRFKSINDFEEWYDRHKNERLSRL